MAAGLHDAEGTLHLSCTQQGQPVRWAHVTEAERGDGGWPPPPPRCMHVAAEPGEWVAGH